jgi:hypothetical protein
VNGFSSAQPQVEFWFDVHPGNELPAAFLESFSKLQFGAAANL